MLRCEENKSRTQNQHKLFHADAKSYKKKEDDSNKNHQNKENSTGLLSSLFTLPSVSCFPIIDLYCYQKLNPKLHAAETKIPTFANILLPSCLQLLRHAGQSHRVHHRNRRTQAHFPSIPTRQQINHRIRKLLLLHRLCGLHTL